MVAILFRPQSANVVDSEMPPISDLSIQLSDTLTRMCNVILVIPYHGTLDVKQAHTGINCVQIQDHLASVAQNFDQCNLDLMIRLRLY